MLARHIHIINMAVPLLVFYGGLIQVIVGFWEMVCRWLAFVSDIGPDRYSRLPFYSTLGIPSPPLSSPRTEASTGHSPGSSYHVRRCCSLLDMHIR